MSTLRLALAGVLVLALVGGAGAADKDDNKTKIVGTWEAVKADEGTVPVGATLEFAKDGKVTMKAKDKTDEGTYKLDGDKLSFKKKGEDKEMTVTIKKLTDKEMTCSDEKGKTVEFKKK